jgi:thiamine-phosphate pyrophosphorylase
MRVIANGKPRDVADGATVADLLAEIGWRPQWVVVERNGEPLERSRFGEVRLAEDDRLEIVRAVAGGASPHRRETLERARLYLCVGGRGGGPELDAFLDAVLGAGVDVLQLREDKSMEARPLLRLAERFASACARHGALFIVNDRPDVALAAGADGVHLGQDDVAPDVARAILGPGAIVGLSTHAPADVRRARDEPVDYIAVGPCFETPTKPGRPAAGLGLLRVAAAEATVPWFAIGGIDSATLPQVVAVGARRVVVVRAITESPDPALAVKALRDALARSP